MRPGGRHPTAMEATDAARTSASVAPTQHERGLDVEAVRADFPYLTDRDGPAVVYLDSGASAQKPRRVLDAMWRSGGLHYANVHRGVHVLAREADDAFVAARARIAAFVGSTPAQTVLGKNVTEVLNLVALTWGGTNVEAGDEVLITPMEHHANLVPWQQLCVRKGATLRYVDLDGDGRLDLDSLDAALAGGRVKVVAVTHVSNVLGTVNPVAEIARRARAAGAISVVDGAQAVPQRPVDVAALGADFYAWTGHKLYGPTGIGVLHASRELLAGMPPLLTGGDMIRTVDLHETTWASGPQRFEAGTPAIVEAVGLAAACDWVEAVGGMGAIHAHEQAVTHYAHERLAAVEGVRVLGPPTGEDRGALIAFVLDGVHPHDTAEIVAREQVCVRAGHHCAEPLHRVLGVPATTRASFAAHTVPSEIDALAGALERARAIFA